MSEGTLPVSEYSSNAATRPATGFLTTSGVTGAETRRSEPEHGTGSSFRSESVLLDRDPSRRYSQVTHTQVQLLDAALLRDAEETLQDLDGANEIDVQLLLTGLVGIIYDLWESAADASERHQDVLSSLENAVRVAAERGRSLSTDEALAISAAFYFLKQPTLVRSNAESLRSEFVEAGFPPLACLD